MPHRWASTNASLLKVAFAEEAGVTLLQLSGLAERWVGSVHGDLGFFLAARRILFEQKRHVWNKETLIELISEQGKIKIED